MLEWERFSLEKNVFLPLKQWVKGYWEEPALELGFAGVHFKK